MARSEHGGRSAPRMWLGAALVLVLSGTWATQAAAQPPPVTPQDFVAAAGGASQYEVMAARVALVESKDGRVRAFAEEMIRDQAAAGAALGDAAMRSGLKPPPATVGADQTMLLAALQGLRGPDFDRAYLRQQVLAHRSALATEGGYARTGSDANLRKVAERDVGMITHHLEEAQALQPPEDKPAP